MHLSAIKKLPQKTLKISPRSLLFRNCLVDFKVLKPKTTSTKTNQVKNSQLFLGCLKTEMERHSLRSWTWHHTCSDTKGYPTAQLWSVTPSFMGWTYRKICVKFASFHFLSQILPNVLPLLNRAHQGPTWSRMNKVQKRQLAIQCNPNDE